MLRNDIKKCQKTYEDRETSRSAEKAASCDGRRDMDLGWNGLFLLFVLFSRRSVVSRNSFRWPWPALGAHSLATRIHSNLLSGKQMSGSPSFSVQIVTDFIMGHISCSLCLAHCLPARVMDQAYWHPILFPVVQNRLLSSQTTHPWQLITPFSSLSIFLSLGRYDAEMGSDGRQSILTMTSILVSSAVMLSCTFSLSSYVIIFNDINSPANVIF